MGVLLLLQKVSGPATKLQGDELHRSPGGPSEDR